MIGESLDHSFFSVKLRGLTLLEALEIDNLPDALREKVASLQREHDEQWGTDYYIRRAAETLLD